jgi:hypothetical protein
MVTCVRYGYALMPAARRLIFAFGLGILLAVAAPSVSAQSLTASSSGTWTTAITLEPLTWTWTLKSDVTLGLDLPDGAATARTVFDKGAWVQQNFTVKCQLGDMDVKSDLRFEPHLHRFRDWITSFRWTWDACSFTLTPKLTRTTDWLIVELDHEGETADVEAAVRLRAPTGSCALVFYDASLELSFTVCAVETGFEIVLDDDGFDRALLTLSDLRAAEIPWVTVDVEIKRTLAAMTVKLKPDIAVGSLLCAGDVKLSFNAELVDAANWLSVRVSEIALSWKVADWKIDVTADLEDDDWLECKAKGTLKLGSAGTLTLDLTSSWTDTTLSEASFALTHKLTSRYTVGVNWTIDGLNERLDSLGLTFEVTW